MYYFFLEVYLSSSEIYVKTVNELVKKFLIPTNKNGHCSFDQIEPKFLFKILLANWHWTMVKFAKPTNHLTVTQKLTGK